LPATEGEMPLVLSRDVGDIRIHTLDAGGTRLDGGAMFGVVPKPLWERRIPADELNRIPLALRCLLIEAPDALVLVDSGIGNKESDKFRRTYAVENAGEPTRLEDSIRAAGFRPDEIDRVILTHLHFDHAGGGTVRRDDGSIEPSFPGAEYIVQRRELEFAGNPNERTRASYLPDNIHPITEAGLWRTVEGAGEVASGVRVFPTPGHTPWHQSVIIESRDEVACFLADLCPTTAHVPLPWIMGYDLEPLVTLESKREMWRQAQEGDWLLIFEHDPVVAWGRLERDGKRIREEVEG